MQFLLFLTIFLTVNADLLNEFSADVDYYDMGIMGRGKNAASWHHSYENQEDVFYYLAMQPWRHLVWTRKGEDGEYYKYIINEDASNIPKDGRKLQRGDTEDYCRKEYAHEIRKFEIDWKRVPQDSASFVKVDINGETCYQYPGKLPLVNVYLSQMHTSTPDKENFKICRMEFVGGRSLTFRSFNQFSKTFVSDDKVSGYLGNWTKCNIDPSPNNLKSDLSIVMGISDSSVVRSVLSQLTQLGDLTTIENIKLYYFKGSSYEAMPLTKDELKSGKKFELLNVLPGFVDPLLVAAKNDMIASMQGEKGNRKGTIVVLTDKTLNNVYDAETAFDRNNITVHFVGFNSRDDNTFRYRATTLLSLGEHYNEFTNANGLTKAMTNLFKGIRVNLTERCDRRTCNGFCDGRDRCTCPMCCENDCFYTYCDVNTASCTPWPKAEPKKKIECAQDCVGTRECKDLVGCVITKYNPGCEPPAKCMRTYCNETSEFKCAFEDTCGKDLVPSPEKDGSFKCWEYRCDEVTGMCAKKKSGKACPKKTSLCEEYVCNEDLVCSTKKKECVKTAPYIEMECYAAKCNERTGQCENKLSCDNWTGCAEGKTTACRCDAQSGYKCVCSADKEGFCTSTEVCDTRWEDLGPICVKSNCLGDLSRDKANCRWMVCNNETLEHEWEYKDCSKEIQFTFKEETLKDLSVDQDDKDKKRDYCLSLYSLTCSNDICEVVESSKSKKIFCGECAVLSDTTTDGVRNIVLGYKQDDVEIETVCAVDGEKIKAECIGEKWVINYEGKLDLNDKNQINEVCSECVGGDDKCSKDFRYREYSFHAEDGSCSRRIKAAASCNACNEGSGRFESTCEGDFTKTHVTSDVTNLFAEKTMTYTIPKLCMYGSQCVPRFDIECMPTEDNGDGIYQIWQLYKGCNDGHDGYVKGTYHYSDKFREDLFNKGQAQSAEFVEEAEREAYCIWEMTTSYECSTCDPIYQGKEVIGFGWNDNCPREQDGRLYICDDGQCITDPNVPCPTKGCDFYIADGGRCEKEIGKSVCDKKEAERVKKLNEGKALQLERFQTYDCVDDETVCDEPEKETESTCSYGFSNNTCIDIFKQYERGQLDFGCYKPVPLCDENSYHCKYARIVNVEDDVDYFLRKSNVVLNNLCYGYECVEQYENGKWTHSWKLKDEFIAKQNPEPRHKCETAICDPETGEPKYTEITCDVEEQFPTISGNQSECFYCQCSYTDGSFVLSMYADTDEKTYSLDACGSCIVTDRDSGKVLNEVPPCVLKQELNLTGAIAGATVAASVVFALVGAMAVVSIGLFQTYQLVTSALKNAITTTVENAEFVAADNEATNVLNAGDD